MGMGGLALVPEPMDDVEPARTMLVCCIKPALPELSLVCKVATRFLPPRRGC